MAKEAPRGVKLTYKGSGTVYSKNPYVEGRTIKGKRYWYHGFFWPEQKAEGIKKVNRLKKGKHDAKLIKTRHGRYEVWATKKN